MYVYRVCSFFDATSEREREMNKDLKSESTDLKGLPILPLEEYFMRLAKHEGVPGGSSWRIETVKDRDGKDDPNVIRYLRKLSYIDVEIPTINSAHFTITARIYTPDGVKSCAGVTCATEKEAANLLAKLASFTI